MALTQSQQTIWSKVILANLNPNSIAVSITNQDYEGDAAKAASVKITSLNKATIGDYDGTDIALERLSDKAATLDIDQKKYFNFYLDTLDKITSAVEATALTSQLADVSADLATMVDKLVFTKMAADVAPANGSNSQICDVYPYASQAGDYHSAFWLLTQLGITLDKQNVPATGRWVVVTPEVHAMLVTDPRFIASGDHTAETTRLNGVVGHAAGFTIYKSNNLPDGLQSAGTGQQQRPQSKLVIAGNTRATTLAHAIKKLESYAPERRFGQAFKGLHVYGAKVARPEAIAVRDVAVTE